MHFAVIPVGPLGRRHAFKAADTVLYHGQFNAQDYSKYLVHCVYLRDKSEIRVIGTSPTQVEDRARELRGRLDTSIEYISGVVYAKGLSQRQQSKTEALAEWTTK